MSLNLILIHHFQKAHRELLSQAPAKHNRLEANDWLEALPRCPISVVAARANNNTRSGFRTHLAISYLAWLPIGTAKTHARAAGLWLLDNSPTRPSKRNNMTVRLCKHPFLPVLPLNLIPKCAFVSNGGRVHHRVSKETFRHATLAPARNHPMESVREGKSMEYARAPVFRQNCD